MKIAIIGAGAIGGYVGAKLALAGNQVTFIVRGANLHAIRDRGIRLVLADGSEQVAADVQATDDYAVPVAAMSRVLAQQTGASVPSRDGAEVVNSYARLDAFGAGASYVGAEGWGGLSVKHTASNYGSPAEADVHIELKQTRVDLRAGCGYRAGFQRRSRWRAAKKVGRFRAGWWWTSLPGSPRPPWSTR